MIKTDAAFGAASVCSLVAVLPMHQHGLCSIRIKSARNIELSKAFELIVHEKGNQIPFATGISSISTQVLFCGGYS